MKFRKSSYCDGASCVEVIFDKAAVHVRDTSGTHVTFTRTEWKNFLQGVKAGEFDLTDREIS